MSAYTELRRFRQVPTPRGWLVLSAVVGILGVASAWAQYAINLSALRQCYDGQPDGQTVVINNASYIFFGFIACGIIFALVCTTAFAYGVGRLPVTIVLCGAVLLALLLLWLSIMPVHGERCSTGYPSAWPRSIVSLLRN